MDREILAFFDAVCRNNSLKVRELAASGIDPNSLHDHGGTPLQTACRANLVEAVKTLLELGVDVNQRFTYTSPLDKNQVEPNRTAIMYATSPEVVQLLLSRGADVNAADAIGTTALMLAGYRGHVEVVEALLAAGANPLARQLPRQEKKGLMARDFAEDKIEVWRNIAKIEPKGAAPARIGRYEQARDVLLAAEKKATGAKPG